MDYISDWLVEPQVKLEKLYPPLCDVYTTLFTKAKALLKMHIVISNESKVNITYEIYNRVDETKKVITFFADAKEYYDGL